MLRGLLPEQCSEISRFQTQAPIKWCQFISRGVENAFIGFQQTQKKGRCRWENLNNPNKTGDTKAKQKDLKHVLQTNHTLWWIKNRFLVDSENSSSRPFSARFTCWLGAQLAPVDNFKFEAFKARVVFSGMTTNSGETRRSLERESPVDADERISDEFCWILKRRKAAKPKIAAEIDYERRSNSIRPFAVATVAL